MSNLFEIKADDSEFKGCNQRCQSKWWWWCDE